jgi:soluble lytic murein transglycosylase-like protein
VLGGAQGEGEARDATAEDEVVGLDHAAIIMSVRLHRSFALAIAAAATASATARADIFTFTDEQGVVHFTNVKPKRKGWSVYAQSGPGKALTVSGASTEGCRASRADVVPARDRAPERYHRYDPHIVEAAHLYYIPEALIRAVIRVESDYDPRVVSCAGAKGLMQIMPDEEVTQRIDHVFDPRENILAGSRLLRLNANRFRGDLERTIAAYHAGVGAVEKYGGIPPYQTTQEYVRLVVRAYHRYLEGAALDPAAGR